MSGDSADYRLKCVSDGPAPPALPDSAGFPGLTRPHQEEDELCKLVPHHVTASSCFDYKGFVSGQPPGLPFSHTPLRS